MFIRAILDGRLVLTRKEDHEIVENLKACGVPPLNGRVDTAANGGAMTITPAADSIESYDYVLRMRIDRVKASAVAALEAEAAEKRAQILEIEGKTAARMWMDDLADFEVAWRRMCLARSEASADTSGSATGLTKIKVKVKAKTGKVSTAAATKSH